MRSTLLMLAAAILAGCITRQAVTQSPQKEDVTWLAPVATLDEREVTEAPSYMDERLEAALTARNLAPRKLPPDRWSDTFTSKRTTDQRLGWLSENAGNPLFLLVESEVRYYSQMGGRFRWTVDVTASVGRVGDMDGVVKVAFKVPVFLDHGHMKEDAAVEAAVPVVERRVGALLDTWLEGQ